MPERGPPSLRPQASYTATPTFQAWAGAAAPAIVPCEGLLWHDAARQLLRLPSGFTTPQAAPAPNALTGADRIIVGASGFWAAGPGRGSLQCFAFETLTCIVEVDVSPERVVDLASDGAGGIFGLLHEGETWRLLHMTHCGRAGATFVLPASATPRQFTYLKSAQRFVVLDRDRTHLHWYAAGATRPERTVALNWPRPCFTADWLGSDARSRLLVAGSDGAEFGGEAHLLVLDDAGSLIEDLTLPAPVTGIAAAHDLLVVTTTQGVLSYATAEQVPDVVAEASCSLMTPMLKSSLAERPRRWLRVEARARLPEGTTLELSWASTEDKDLLAQLASIAGDGARPAGERLRQLRTTLPNWTTTILQGSAAMATLADDAEPISAPLFDARDSNLWIYATLSAGPGATLPELRSLDVLYAAPTLMDQLPAVYRRAEAEPRSFLRAMVGVLETTTQSLDRRIAAMGAKVDPDSAPPDWLDFVARWLGVPWSDSLSTSQKRELIRNAERLAAMRGTRRGLELLLDCLLRVPSGQPPRYRVVDVATDFTLALPGGSACAGSALPALLGGLPRSALVLDRRAELGYGRLPCSDNASTSRPTQLANLVRVDLAVTETEQGDWHSWLPALLQSVVPVTARMRLRWLPRRALQVRDRLGDDLQLEDPPLTRLGVDAVLGSALLPHGPPPNLPATLNSSNRI